MVSMSRESRERVDGANHFGVLNYSVQNSISQYNSRKRNVKKLNTMANREAGFGGFEF